MKKSFNVSGICYPDRHYMVNLDGRLKEIKLLVDEGKYFIINRARQYGKTTTLWALSVYLKEDYIVIPLDFQKMSTAKFKNETVFSIAFARAVLKAIKNKRIGITGLKEEAVLLLEKEITSNQDFDLVELFEHLSEICGTAEKPLVLMIDEVDSASNNQVFLDFLAQLRGYYLTREVTPIFQSVILAGVYDVKNLRQKIRPDDEHKHNSPWNIAADFQVNMSFSVDDITGMLAEYERDYKTGMAVQETAELIYDYTSGYPYLVSRLCKILDEQIAGASGFKNKSDVWTKQGILEAVKCILKESNPLFDDMIKKLEDYPRLRSMLQDILFNGQSYVFNIYNYSMNIGKMLGFISERNGEVQVANRIFETQLYNYFLSEEMTADSGYRSASINKNQFIRDGNLDMDLVMRKFKEYFTDIYTDSDDKFIEKNGRKLFLLYLKPIINGTGNYYVEAQTRDMKRTDVIVDYLGKQSVIELKIWHGDEYNRRGEQQLSEYLDRYHLTRGYMLSFDFNKKKKAGIHEILCGGRAILEVVV